MEISELEWKSIISGKLNPEANSKCIKCGKDVVVHPNYAKSGINVCIRNGCGTIENSISEMLTCRGYKLIKIEKTGTGSNITIYFLCNKGHDSNLKYKNLKHGASCKKCTGEKMGNDRSKKDSKKITLKKTCNCKSKVCEHYNHQICCPDSAKEWAYDLNTGKSPKNYGPSSDKKVWWRCSNDWCEMTYEQSFHSRVLGKRCPYCAGQKVCQWNCLATTHPEISKEWDYENNKEDTPQTVTHGSNKTVWWICNNHDPIFRYQKSVNMRISLNQGCSKCNDPRYEQIIGGNNHFINEANITHKGKYLYIEEYKGTMIKIQIYCPKLNKRGVPHGIFMQRPNSHKSGDGCPTCAYENKKSKLAALISDQIRNLGYEETKNWILEYKHESLKFIAPLRIDNVLLDIKLAIEVDGAQHFKQYIYEETSNSLIERITRDIIKDKFCLENGFSLIRIPCNHKNPEEYLKYAINLCRQGIRIYFTYQHYFDQIVKSVNIDWSKIYILAIKCPTLNFNKTSTPKI